MNTDAHCKNVLALVGVERCREYVPIYRAAVKKLVTRYGKNARYRREWTAAAWGFRRIARNP